jgi:hypothetical protein
MQNWCARRKFLIKCGFTVAFGVFSHLGSKEHKAVTVPFPVEQRIVVLVHPCVFMNFTAYWFLSVTTISIT